jgi:hypothetical protein
MIEISAVANSAHARRVLGSAVRQLPFVTAAALTSVVKLAQVAEQRALPSVFDKPTPFTQRGIGVQTATKGSLRAAVYVRPQQAAAGLLLQETGGIRTPKKRALVTPAGARLNQYGNLPRRGVKNMLARPNVFSGMVKGVPGIWQRPAKQKGRQGSKLSPKLLVRYEDEKAVTPRFGFLPRAEKVIRAAMAPAFREALARVLRSAR